jgi:hypothetical protein
MPKITAGDLRNPRNRLHVVIVEAVSGMHSQPDVGRVLGRHPDPLQFASHDRFIISIRVGARVEFDDGRPDLAGRLYLGFFRINEQRHPDPDVAEPPACLRNPVFLTCHIEPAFSGQFFTVFRHQTAIFRLRCESDLQHLLGNRHLEIHAGLQYSMHSLEITILDMPAVFTQVQRDAVGSRLLRHQRCIHRVRIAGTARLSYGRYVIDVDAKENPVFHILPRDTRSRAL